MKQLSDYTLLEQNPFSEKDEESIARLAANIERLPKMLALRPIVVDVNNVVVAGNKRYRALIHLGYVEVPDNWIKHIRKYTEKERKELIVLDNVSEGKWEVDVLIREYPEIDLSSIGIDLEAYKGIDYLPNYNPEAGDNFIDSQAITTTADRLAGAMSGEQTMVRIICPHCTEEFDIKV